MQTLSIGRSGLHGEFLTVKSKLKLHGFNNLTKTLSFNIYDICYAETPQDQQAYVEYINQEYDAERLTQNADVSFPDKKEGRPTGALLFACSLQVSRRCQMR